MPLERPWGRRWDERELFAHEALVVVVCQGLVEMAASRHDHLVARGVFAREDGGYANTDVSRLLMDAFVAAAAPPLSSCTSAAFTNMS